MQLRLEKRAAPSRVMLYATPVAAVLLTMVVGAVAPLGRRDGLGLAPREMPERLVASDCRQPGLLPARIAQGRRVPPRTQEGVLDDVLRFGGVPPAVAARYL